MFSHALLALAICASPVQDKKSNATIQDTWNIAIVEQDGVKEPRKKPRPARVITFQKDGFELKEDGRVVESGGYKIDASKSPITIDLAIEEGEWKGKTLPGIIDIKGDALQLCLDLNGKNRPGKFETAPNSGHFLAMAQRGRQAGVDPKDASIVYDKPWEMGSGFKAYNGKIYDKTILCINPKDTLVLPKNAIVERHDKADEVLIFMEKRADIRAHFPRPFSVVDQRDRLGCAAKLEKGLVLIGTFGEYSFLEGSVKMKLLIVAPKNAVIEFREGLSSAYGGRGGSDRPANAINPTRDDPKPTLSKTKEGMPACWLAPTAEDGWHAIPASADVDRRVAKVAKKD